MKHWTKTIDGYGGCPIHVRCWSSDEDPKAGLHILHGMAEHGKRYEDFAVYLAERGFVVWVHDHRQHGQSIGHHTYGILDDNDTWFVMVEDIETVQGAFRKEYEGLPMFMLGHSMGSLLLRTYLQNHKTSLNGTVIMGSPYSAKGLSRVGIFLGNLISRFRPFERSDFLNNLTVGPFNNVVKNPRTPFDWISYNEDMVDAYAADPMCGYSYNANFYRELAKGALEASDENAIARFPEIPTMFISGVEDPCGNAGVGVKIISEWYRNAGKHHELMLLEGMRHEVLNEVNNHETYKHVHSFMEAQLV